MKIRLGDVEEGQVFLTLLTDRVGVCLGRTNGISIKHSISVEVEPLDPEKRGSPHHLVEETWGDHVIVDVGVSAIFSRT